MMITSADFLPLLPEIFLRSATCALLFTDLFISPARRGLVHFLALAILAVTAILTLRGVPGVELPVRVFSGSFQQHPMIAFTAAMTLVIGAAYTLWLVKRVMYGEVANAHVAELEDLNGREWLVLGVFAIGVLLIGVWPKPLTDLMEPSIAQLAGQLAASKL